MSTWRDALTEPEAREVDALDTIIAGCKAALHAASARRAFIQDRASTRRSWRIKHGVEKPRVATVGVTND